jgi:hypothetical protein
VKVMDKENAQQAIRWVVEIQNSKFNSESDNDDDAKKSSRATARCCCVLVHPREHYDEPSSHPASQQQLHTFEKINAPP